MLSNFHFLVSHMKILIRLQEKKGTLRPPLPCLSFPVYTLSSLLSPTYLFHFSAVRQNLHINLKMRSVISHNLSCIIQCIWTWIRFNIATEKKTGGKYTK